jgi:hypothetical protein
MFISESRFNGPKEPHDALEPQFGHLWYMFSFTNEAKVKVRICTYSIKGSSESYDDKHCSV